MRMTGVLAMAAAAALAGSGLSGSLRAQDTAAGGSRFRVGIVIPAVKSSADTSERYALYLPSHYDVSRRWPALLVLDPRGRAVLAMERFREAAERDGYIVVSSYNTVSDSTDEPNVRAVNAMLADLQNAFATDTTRMYFAGMSGTARLAWTFAYELSGHVAGILGFAAGLPWRRVEAYVRLKQPASFVYFGGAGTGDFNFDEVRGLDHALDSLDVLPHRAEYFDGQHGWPPASVCGDGLDWMELQAMKRGQRRREDSLAWRVVHPAHGAGASGRRIRAGRSTRSFGTGRFATTSAGLPTPRVADDRVAVLQRLPAVRDHERRDQSLEIAFESYARYKFTPFIHDLQNAAHPPSLGSALHDLDIRNLQRQQRDSVHDRLGAQSAGRMLALVSINTGFYEPRRYFRQGDPAGALAMLAIAHEIAPVSPYICLQQAKAYAEMGRTGNALSSLRCAKAGGTLSVADLRDEHAFDRLWSDSAFAALAASLPPAPAPGTDN